MKNYSGPELMALLRAAEADGAPIAGIEPFGATATIGAHAEYFSPNEGHMEESDEWLVIGALMEAGQPVSLARNQTGPGWESFDGTARHRALRPLVAALLAWTAARPPNDA